MTVNETIASPFVSIGADTGGAALVSPAVFELSILEYVIYISDVLLDLGPLARLAVVVAMLMIGSLCVTGVPTVRREQTSARSTREAERRHRANVEAQLNPQCPCGALADHFRSMPQRSRGRLCLSCHLDGRVPPSVTSSRPPPLTVMADHGRSPTLFIAASMIGDGGSDGGDGGGD